MDISTLIGLVAGLVLIIGSIAAGGAMGSFIHVPSMLITIGGSVSAIFIAYPLNTVKSAISVVKKCFFADNFDVGPWYKSLVDIATIARRDGMLAMEEKIPELEDEFLKRGLQMMVDGNSPEVVKAILEQEIENMEARHEIGASVFKNLGSYCPAFGMIGTLIGLVQMLQNLSDPSQIGAGMAVALLTTLYGAFVANLLCIPLQGKLEQRSAEEVNLKKMLLTGILAIQAGESPRVVGQKLAAYLNPGSRDEVMNEGKSKGK